MNVYAIIPHFYCSFSENLLNATTFVEVTIDGTKTKNFTVKGPTCKCLPWLRTRMKHLTEINLKYIISKCMIVILSCEIVFVSI